MRCCKPYDDVIKSVKNQHVRVQTLSYYTGDEDKQTHKSEVTMATYGKIQEFKPSEENWNQYVERLEQYFIANDVKDMAKQRAIFLSVCGSKTYAVLRDVLQPRKPAEITLKDIFAVLAKHFNPTPSLIVERFKFHSRARATNESVAEFVAGLRKLTEHCDFRDSLEDMLRDRLVCGVNDEKIQRRL